MEREPTVSDHDNADIPNCNNLFEYKKTLIPYIAGYVDKMTSKKNILIKCQNALVLPFHLKQNSFLKFKDIGGLIKPTISVICKETERCFQINWLF